MKDTDPRIRTLLRRLAQGERDAQLLDGRDFRPARWRVAGRALASLENDAGRLAEVEASLRELLDYQWAIGWTPTGESAAEIAAAYERARQLLDGVREGVVSG